MSKRAFTAFLDQLFETFDIVFNHLDDAFKRDGQLTQSLLETQFNATGTAIMVKMECHNNLKSFQSEIIKKGFQRPIYLPFFEDECFDYNNYESMIKAHSKTNLRSYRSNNILSTQRDTTYATHKSDTKPIDVHLLNKNVKKNNMSTDQKFSMKTSDRSKKKPRVSRPRSAKSGKSNRSQKSRDYNARGRDQTQDAHHERDW